MCTVPSWSVKAIGEDGAGGVQLSMLKAEGTRSGVRVVSDIMLRRVHGRVGDGLSSGPVTKAWTCCKRVDFAIRVTLERGLEHRRWLKAGPAKFGATSNIQWARVTDPVGRILQCLYGTPWPGIGVGARP